MSDASRFGKRLDQRGVTVAFVTAEEREALRRYRKPRKGSQVRLLLQTLQVLGDVSLQLMAGSTAESVEMSRGDVQGDREEMRQYLLLALPLVEMVRQKSAPLPENTTEAFLRRRVIRYRTELQSVIGTDRFDRINNEILQSEQAEQTEQTGSDT